MAFVTALGFVLSGIALLFLASSAHKATRLLGYVITASSLGILVVYGLVEYLSLNSFAFYVRGKMGKGVGFDGRMSPNSALCFMILGMLLVLAAASRPRLRLRLMTVLVSVLISAAFLAMCSQMIGLSGLQGAWRFIAMAIHTSALFGFTGLVLLVWIMRQTARQKESTAQALPFFTLALGLIAVVGLVSRVSSQQLGLSKDRLAHTYQVVDALDRLIAEVARMENSARGYALTGQDSFHRRVFDHQSEITAMLDQLTILAMDDPVQKKQVAKLREQAESKKMFTLQLLGARDVSGQEVAMRMLSEQSDEVGSRLVRIAEEMHQVANVELVQRQRDMTNMELGARNMQIGAAALAFLLVMLAFGLEYRASYARARAEEELQSANLSLETRVRERTAELQKAVDQRIERERSMRFLADALSQLVWAMLPDGSTTAFNRSWYEYTGLSEEESKRSWWEKIIHPQDLEETWKIWGQIRRSGKEGGGEFRLRRASDGLYRWMLWRARPEFNSEGVLLRWVGTMTDIHDQKAAAELMEDKVNQRTAELARVSLLQRGVLDGTIFSIIATDPQGLITEFNKGAERILGYKREQMVGKQTPALFHNPEEVAERAALLTKQLGQLIEPGFEVFVAEVKLGKIVESEWNYIRNDGTKLPVLLSVTALRDPQGDITGFLGLAQDLTERKQSEEALRNSGRRLLEAQKIARLGNFEFNPEERNTAWWSDELFRIFGLEPANRPVPPEEFFSMIHPDDREAIQGIISHAIAVKENYHHEYRIRRRDGEERYLSDEGRMVLDKHGTLLKVQGVIQDITERKQLLDHLAHVRDQALEASRVKSEFLANISHELRTPMNGIIGMASILMGSRLTAEQQEMGRVIQGSAENLLTIINDILDFSKIEAGKMRIITGNFELQELVEESLSLLASRAREKKLELVCDYGLQGPMQLLGDAGRIRQVLTNLVGNAIKFTDNGEVLVSVTMIPARQGRCGFRVEVRDSGIGVPENQQSRLFQSFSQVDGTHTRRFGGTGLGLAISRQLVELMEGSIGFSSQLGKGSTFWFQMELPESGSKPSTIAALLSDREKILVVDDHAASSAIEQRQLVQLGARVASAPDAITAMNLLREAAQAGDPYRIVLLDEDIQERSGIQLAMEIREDPTLSNLELILLGPTRLDLEPDIARRARIKATVPKPIRLVQLHRALVQSMVMPVPEQPAHSGAQSPASGYRLLVAEDNEANQIVVRHMLALLGHDTVIVPDGLAAIEALRKERFAAVLMDCQMPQMDGYEATRRLRAGAVPGLRADFPIIALTAYALPADREKCLAAGMTEYLTKPIRMDRLREILLQFDIKSSAPGTSAAPEVSEARNTEKEELDSQQMEEMRSLPGRKTTTLLEDLILIIMEEAPANLHELRSLADMRDAQSLGKLAHRLAGSFGNVGGRRMRDEALKLERLAKAENWEQIPVALALFENNWVKLEARLQQVRKSLAQTNPAATV